MKKIIIPTDFSENAQKAIDYALHLFEKEVCTFYILHAYHEAPSSSKTKMSTEEDLNQLIKRLKSTNDNKKHHFEKVFETESVVNLTSRTQIDKAVDYIFVGTKGSSALREIFVGSNTMDLIKYVNNCPIMVVPTVYKYAGIKEMVFATDFKHSFLHIEIMPLINITKTRDTILNIVHIKMGKVFTDAQKSNKELLRSVLKGIKHQFFEVEVQDNVGYTLYEIEKVNTNIGMIIILKTKHGFFRNLTHENVLKNIALTTEIPLLVLPQIE